MGGGERCGAGVPLKSIFYTNTLFSDRLTLLSLNTYKIMTQNPTYAENKIKKERRNCNPATSKVTATAWCELCVQSEMKHMHKVKDARQCYS